MIAALYVDVRRGPYAALGLDCWGEDRDAKLYAGPGPVIAHPPCGPWGKYAHRCHQDPSCGPAAVEAVRRWGGVLEHPAHSKLWRHCQLPSPGEFPDAHGGWTLEVRQRDWGHEANKRTWLYIVGTPPQAVPEMPPPGPPAKTYRKASGRLATAVENMSRYRRHLTPPAFARWLIELVKQRHDGAGGE